MTEDPHSNTRAIPVDVNPNHRTEQEYRALIRSWIHKLKSLPYDRILDETNLDEIIKEMEKEVP